MYIKSRSLSYDQQEIVRNVLTEVLNSNQTVEDIRAFYWVANTQNVQFNSTFYMVQRQTTLVLLFAQMVTEKYPSTNLSELLFSRLPITREFRNKLDIKDININNLLLYSVLKFYDDAFVHDVEYRRFWISTLTNSTELTALSDNLSNFITRTFSATRKNAPWDYRRMPALGGDVDNIVNRVSLFMNYLVLKHRCLQLDCYPLGGERMDVNLKQYSRECIKGRP